MRIKRYVFAKTKQIKHISWFLAGFAFGVGALWVALVAMALAIVFDFLSYIVSPPEKKKEAGA